MGLRTAFNSIFLVIILSSCHKTPPPPKDPCTHFEGTAMTLPYHIIVGKNLSDEQKNFASEIIQNTFNEIDSTFNNWNPQSEISKINEAPADQPIPLSPQLDSLLTLCNEIVALSGGRFDPSIEPLQNLWRESLKDKKMPQTEDLQKACDAIGWAHFSMKNGILKKDQIDAHIDLCSISKGLCVDWLIERLSGIGYTDLFVDWSGEIRAIGRHPEKGDWALDIDPGLTTNGQQIEPIQLNNKAISVSGDLCPRGWTLPPQASPDGQLHRYFPIIDPLTAQPLEKTEYSIAFAMVIAPTCALADALATAAMLFPNRLEAEKWASEVVELYPEVSFWILSYDKNRLF